MLDPGIGFAKTTQHNLELSACLAFKPLATLLVGTSRKRFIGEVLTNPDPAHASGAQRPACQAVAAGAAVVRVHDVGLIVQTCRMAEALFKPNAANRASNAGLSR